MKGKSKMWIRNDPEADGLALVLYDAPPVDAVGAAEPVSAEGLRRPTVGR